MIIQIDFTMCTYVLLFLCGKKSAAGRSSSELNKILWARISNLLNEQAQDRGVAEELAGDHGKSHTEDGAENVCRMVDIIPPSSPEQIGDKQVNDPEKKTRYIDRNEK